jgi:hypothetical protein
MENTTPISDFRPGALMLRTAISYAKKFSRPLATKNEYGVWDVAFADGRVDTGYRTGSDVLANHPVCVMHFPVTGAFCWSEEVAS